MTIKDQMLVIFNNKDTVAARNLLNSNFKEVITEFKDNDFSKEQQDLKIFFTNLLEEDEAFNLALDVETNMLAPMLSYSCSSVYEPRLRKWAVESTNKNICNIAKGYIEFTDRIKEQHETLRQSKLNNNKEQTIKLIKKFHIYRDTKDIVSWTLNEFQDDPYFQDVFSTVLKDTQ